jgi:aromatic-L-amino-acid/L-tryptophan decarboxylase
MQNTAALLQRLAKLETETRSLEPQGRLLQELTDKVVHYAQNYLNSVSKINAYSGGKATGKQLLGTPFAEDGRSLDELLPIIAEDVDGPGINPASGGHLGYIPGGGIYPTALGDYLAAVTNKYSGVYYASPGAVQLENMVIRWLCAIIGFPASAMGNLTSGGSIANLIAIVTARDARGITSDRIKKSCIYLTRQAHHSVHKAIRIAGLGEAHIQEIDVDEYFRMDTQKLSTQVASDLADGLQPFLVIASAGTTDTGSIDPLDTIAAIARETNLWFHVDAAYGGFFMLVDEMKNKFTGIDKADSLTIDPHKGLFLAYGLGAVLVKDVAALKNSHYYQANYMQDVTEVLEEPSPADLSPELTKHFRGLRMWLPLQLFGVGVFRKALEEKVLLCHYFYQKVQDLGFDVGPEPELSVCIYRFSAGIAQPNQFNQQLIKSVQDDGRIFISSTTIDGIFWLRLAVLVFRTHKQTIDELLAILEDKRNMLLATN